MIAYVENGGDRAWKNEWHGFKNSETQRKERNGRTLRKEKYFLLLDKIIDDEMVMTNYLDFSKVHGAMYFLST